MTMVFDEKPLALPVSANYQDFQDQVYWPCVCMVPPNQEKTPAWQRQSKELAERGSWSLLGMAELEQEQTETLMLTDFNPIFYIFFKD